MKWNEIQLTTSHEASEAGANIFFDIGAQGVVIEDPYVVHRYVQEDKWDCFDSALNLILEDVVVIKGYLPVDENFSKRMDLFAQKLRLLQECFHDCQADVVTSEIAEENWASSWKQYYKTTRIGKRIVIKPEWEKYDPFPEEIVIEMDPGTAFGTGTHATTIMCLQLLEKFLQPGQIVFDVGCGSGILSVASVKLGADFVFARDIDLAAIKAANHNSKINNVEAKIEVETGYFLNSVQGKAHLIACNIVSDSIIEFSPQAFEKLLPEGNFIVSGIIADRADEVTEKLMSDGFSVLETLTQGEWVAIAAEKRKEK